MSSIAAACTEAGNVQPAVAVEVTHGAVGAEGSITGWDGAKRPISIPQQDGAVRGDEVRLSVTIESATTSGMGTPDI
jgi:hypothetical protein